MKLISVCPLCDEHYNPTEAQLVGEAEDSHLLHITCRKCRNSIIALVIASAGGMSSVGLVTDLNFDEVVKFRTTQGVSEDDVLEMHGTLEDEDFFWRSVGGLDH